MIGRVTSAIPWGAEARMIRIEADVFNGMPRFDLEGLSDSAARESRERVRSAMRNAGNLLPPRRIRVTASPELFRHGLAHLDLSIALAILAALGQLPQEALDNRLVCGEFGFDGAVRSVKGGLALAELAAREGISELLLPPESAAEAAAFGDVVVIPVRSLSEAIGHLRGEAPLMAASVRRSFAAEPHGEPDLAQMRGQEAAKRALEVAAAGGHSLLLVGPPRSGKTLLARRLPGILPPMTREEAVTATKIHSLVAQEPFSQLLCQRPFRAPHPGVSLAGLVGGGSFALPGEASLAHAGVLFLDDLPEFRRSVLEALRQPLEEGRMTILRTRTRMTLPARFALIAAMKGCPCGHYGDPRHECRCPAPLVRRYRSRLTGPCLDAIDLFVEMPAVSGNDLARRPAESSAQVAERVRGARLLQEERFGSQGARPPVNASMDAGDLERHVQLDKGARAVLESRSLSPPDIARVLKVTRTIADLDGRHRIGAPDVAEAIYLTAHPSREIAS